MKPTKATTGSNGPACQHCGKQIQYVTSSAQVFCSNTCRSKANQVKRVAQLTQLKVVATKKEDQKVRQMPAAPPANGLMAVATEALASGSPEHLWKLLEAAINEIAELKAKNTLMEQELGRFRRVTGNIFYQAS